VVICLERGADLHMAQLMPLPLTVFASVKSRLVLPFWCWLTQVVLEKEPLNGCVCVLLCFHSDGLNLCIVIQYCLLHVLLDEERVSCRVTLCSVCWSTEMARSRLVSRVKVNFTT